MRKKIMCGAKTRRDKPCVAKALPNGRCRNHGGLSTGPKTPEGKARSLAALKQNGHGGGVSFSLNPIRGMGPDLD
jgi:hypothetical protein